MAPSDASADKLRQALHGMPPSILQACEHFRVSGDRGSFDRAVLEIVEHHLRQRPSQPLASLPGSVALVADLGLDSLTMVELAFLFEDVFEVRVPQEALAAVVTLDDLRALLHAHLPAHPPA